MSGQNRKIGQEKRPSSSSSGLSKPWTEYKPGTQYEDIKQGRISIKSSCRAYEIGKVAKEYKRLLEQVE